MTLPKLLALTIGGAFLLNVVVFTALAVLGALGLLPPDWVGSVLFPGWALFWPHGIHSNALFKGFLVGGVVNIVAYALIILAAYWTFITIRGRR